jgi:hypothetical protein
LKCFDSIFSFLDTGTIDGANYIKLYIPSSSIKHLVQRLCEQLINFLGGFSYENACLHLGHEYIGSSYIVTVIKLNLNFITCLIYFDLKYHNPHRI